MNHKKKKKKEAFAGILLLFGLLTLGLFREGWFRGSVIQGIDGNYSYLMLLRNNLMDGRFGWWDPSHWLGIGQPFGINSIYLFLRVLPERMQLMVGYSVMIFISLLFMWLLLRRLRMDFMPSVFGSLAFGFAPHFITLIYPGHIDCVHVPALAAMLFYFMTVALDGQTPGRLTWLCIPAAGFGWGMMMNADVQRGLYFSVAASFYALYLILRKGGFNKSDSSGKSAAERIRGLLVLSAIGLFALLIFAHNAQIQFGSELVSGRVSGVEEESPQAEAEKWAFATSWSFHPKELLDSFAPGYHGMISGDPERPYWGSRPVAHSNDGLGYFVLFFGLAGMLTVFRKSVSVRFFAIMTLLATLLAFGEYWPGRPLFTLWYHLPMMAKMRAPVKFISVAAFGLSILSAYGFQNLLDSIREQRRVELKRWLYAFGALAGCALLGLLSTLSGDGAFPSEKAQDGAMYALGWMMFFSLAGSGLMAVSLARRQVHFRSRMIGGCFVFLMIFNLFQINRFYIQRSWFDPDEFYKPDQVIQFLQKNQSERNRVTCSFKMIYQGRMIPLSLMATRDIYGTHLFRSFGIEAMEHTPQSRIADDYDAFFRVFLPQFPQAGSEKEVVGNLLDGQIRFWKLSGVKYILTDGYLYGISQQPLPVYEVMKKHPALQLCFTGNGFGGRRTAVFELKETLPQFTLVSSIERVPTPDAVLERMRSPEYNPKVSMVVSEMSGRGLRGSDFSTGSVSIAEYRPGEIRLIIETSGPAVLLWLSRFDAGWEAKVNGQATEIFPVNFMMTGIPMLAGFNEIRLCYNPQSLFQKISMGAATFGFLCVPVSLLCLIRQRPVP